jgi:phosphatidylglycerophosphatase A
MSQSAGGQAASLNPSDPKQLLALGFGAGLSPVAPGTVGTLVGVALYLVLSMLPTLLYVVIVAGLFAAGVWAIGGVSDKLGSDDPPAIVWDEVVGFLVAMIAAPAGILWIILGFLPCSAPSTSTSPGPSPRSRAASRAPSASWMMVEASLRGAAH